MRLYHYNDKNKKIIRKMIILTENEYSDPIMLQVLLSLMRKQMLLSQIFEFEKNRQGEQSQITRSVRIRQ